MIVATLLSGVLPDTVAAAEMYEDPPDLIPLPEEEPLIARSVAKRRNEFVTVRHCGRRALQELGVPPVPILKGFFAFGLIALLYLVTEELLVEAHEAPEGPIVTSMFFIGFLALLMLEEGLTT